MPASIAAPTAWTQVVHPDDLPRALAPPRRDARERRDVRDRVPLPRGRRQLPLAPRPRAPDARRRRAIEFWVGTATDIHDRQAHRGQRSDSCSRPARSSAAHSTTERRSRRSPGSPCREIADWCSVHLVEDDGTIQELARRARRPRQDRLRTRAAAALPAGGRGPTGAGRRDPQRQAASSSRDVTDELLEAAAARRAPSRAAPRARHLVLPLRAARGARARRSARSRSSRPSRAAASASATSLLAEELARRAAHGDRQRAALPTRPSERARAARVLDTIGDGVALLDRDGVVRLWNTAAEAITGLRPSAILGRPAEEALPGWTPTARAPRPRSTSARRDASRSRSTAASSGSPSPASPSTRASSTRSAT